MDNFKIIYKILKTLESSLDYDDFSFESIGHERFGITKNRWTALMRMLINSGYIEATTFDRFSITLKGLEYLRDDTAMKRAAKEAKIFTDLL